MDKPACFAESWIKKRRLRYNGGVIGKETLLDLLPHVIVGRPALECVLGAVFIEHALEDGHIAAVHIGNLKADTVRVGIHMVGVAPAAAGNEHHGVFIGDITGQVDMHPEILPGWYLFGAVQPKSSGADVCDISNQALADIVCNWHIVGEVTTSNFSFFGHDGRSFHPINKYMASINTNPY